LGEGRFSLRFANTSIDLTIYFGDVDRIDINVAIIIFVFGGQQVCGRTQRLAVAFAFYGQRTVYAFKADRNLAISKSANGLTNCTPQPMARPAVPAKLCVRCNSTSVVKGTVPLWAILVAVIGAPFTCLLSLLFLLIKDPNKCLNCGLEFK